MTKFFLESNLVLQTVVKNIHTCPNTLEMPMKVALDSIAEGAIEKNSETVKLLM